jgi:hypothetical protein
VIAILVVRAASADDRTLVAEGDYVVSMKDGFKPIDHWKLWHERDGEFSVEAAGALPPHADAAAMLVQTFKFNRQFLPVGYSLVAATGESEKIQLSCRYRSEKQMLSCDTQYEGKELSASAKARGPCVVIMSEFPGLDIPWFYASLLRIAEATKSVNVAEVEVFVVDENESGNITVKPDLHPARFTFSHKETVTIDGKSWELSVWAHDEAGQDPTTIKIRDDGVVVSVGRSGRTLMELKNYIERQPWRPSQ